MRNTAIRGSGLSALFLFSIVLCSPASAMLASKVDSGTSGGRSGAVHTDAQTLEVNQSLKANQDEDPPLKPESKKRAFHFNEGPEPDENTKRFQADEIGTGLLVFNFDASQADDLYFIWGASHDAILLNKGRRSFNITFAYEEESDLDSCLEERSGFYSDDFCIMFRRILVLTSRGLLPLGGIKFQSLYGDEDLSPGEVQSPPWMDAGVMKANYSKYLAQVQYIDEVTVNLNVD